jgi:SAM-dependent methyltransferase
VAVAENEVAAAYRMLLGREPSVDEARLWLAVESVGEIRRIFMESDEFRAMIPNGKDGPTRDRFPLDVAPIAVEWSTTPHLQDALLSYVTHTWTNLGESEPHWSVLSSDQFKSANIEKHKAEFYASGAVDAGRITAILNRNGAMPADFPHMVEYGCGVGRVTPHLAAIFDDVLGIDISSSHLSLARETLAQSQHTNTKLVLARAPDFGMHEPIDLWFSRIVLQHNTPPIMALVLRRMFSRLVKGGIAIFQVPTYVKGYSFDVAAYLAAPKLNTIEVHCLPQAVVFQLAEEGGCIPLEVREDDDMEYPWLSNTFVFRKR